MRVDGFVIPAAVPAAGIAPEPMLSAASSFGARFASIMTSIATIAAIDNSHAAAEAALALSNGGLASAKVDEKIGAAPDTTHNTDFDSMASSHSAASSEVNSRSKLSSLNPNLKFVAKKGATKVTGKDVKTDVKTDVKGSAHSDATPRTNSATVLASIASAPVPSPAVAALATPLPAALPAVLQTALQITLPLTARPVGTSWQARSLLEFEKQGLPAAAPNVREVFSNLPSPDRPLPLTATRLPSDSAAPSSVASAASTRPASSASAKFTSAIAVHLPADSETASALPASGQRTFVAANSRPSVSAQTAAAPARTASLASQPSTASTVLSPPTMASSAIARPAVVSSILSAPQPTTQDSQTRSLATLPVPASLPSLPNQSSDQAAPTFVQHTNAVASAKRAVNIFAAPSSSVPLPTATSTSTATAALPQLGGNPLAAVDDPSSTRSNTTSSASSSTTSSTTAPKAPGLSDPRRDNPKSANSEQGKPVLGNNEIDAASILVNPATEETHAILEPGYNIVSDSGSNPASATALDTSPTGAADDSAAIAFAASTGAPTGNPSGNAKSGVNPHPTPARPGQTTGTEKRSSDVAQSKVQWNAIAPNAGPSGVVVKDSSATLTAPTPPTSAPAAQVKSGPAPALPGAHQMLDSAPALAPAATTAVAAGSAAEAQLNSQMNGQMHVGIRTAAFGAVEIHTVVQQSQVGITVHADRDLTRWFSSEVPSLESGLNQHHLHLTAVDFDSGRSGVSAETGFQHGEPRQHFFETHGFQTADPGPVEKEAALESAPVNISDVSPSVGPALTRVNIHV